MAANLARLEEVAWPLFRAGHLPMIGEWVALPVLASAGEPDPLGPLAAEVMYPTAERLLAHCDAVLRLPGDSDRGRPGRRDRPRAGSAGLLPARGRARLRLAGHGRRRSSCHERVERRCSAHRPRSGRAGPPRPHGSGPGRTRPDRQPGRRRSSTSSCWLRVGTCCGARRTATATRTGGRTTEQRETYDRGNGATILLYDVERRTVLLTRQFRFPVYVNGHPDGMLIETAAGLLDDDDPRHRDPPRGRGGARRDDRRAHARLRRLDESGLGHRAHPLLRRALHPGGPHRTGWRAWPTRVRTSRSSSSTSTRRSA